METDSSKTIGLQQYLDTARLSRRQRIIVVLIFLTMITEGLDVTIVSHVFPHLIKGWGTSIGEITLIVTLSSVVLAIGAFAAGVVADRIGRKPVLLGSIFIFAVGTALMGVADDVPMFLAFRLLACVGIGAALVIPMTTLADLMPSPRRAQMMTLGFAGVTLGGVVGGYLAALLIPTAGWPALVIVGGVIPLLLLPFLFVFVPESPGYLALRGRPAADIHRVLSTLTGERDVSLVDVSAPEKEASAPVSQIFSRAFLGRTLLLWVFVCVGMGVVQVVLQYLPTLLQQPSPGPGLSAAQSGVTVATMGWGGLIGGILASFILKRFNRFLTVSVLLAGAVVVALTIATVPLQFTGYLVVFFAWGLFLPASNTATAAVVTLTYPVRARGTGLGASSAVGRFAQLGSGLLGGMMIAAGSGIAGIFLALSAPILIGALSTVALHSVTRRREAEAPTPMPRIGAQNGPH